MERFNVNIFQKGVGSVSCDRKPDECPICHNGIDPDFFNGFGRPSEYDSQSGLQIIFICPRLSCHRLFIAHYRSNTQEFSSCYLQRVEPINKSEKTFSKTIQEISKDFCEIFNQALSAEQQGLLEICGVGYRKSLEFLIKDYLIGKYIEKKPEIEKKALATCVSEYIENVQIKEVAKRAVWLGNDESHYLKKWEGKNLQDLKKLIDLVVHWFEMEQLTKEIQVDMPEGK